MKTKLASIILLSISILLLSTCKKDDLPVYGEKTYVGDIINPTAEELQKILSMGYDTIIGDVVFDDFYEEKVSDLRTLRNIRLISGRLVFTSVFRFKSFYGFDNLKSVGGMFIYHTGFTSFDGLDSLKYISENLGIRYNDSLIDINGLNNLDSIGEDFTIWSNYYLENIDGLVNLKTIGGNLWIGGFSIKNLDSLANLESIGGGFSLSDIYNLESIEGLNKLVTIGGDLRISIVYELNSLEGLNALQHIGGDILLVGIQIKDLDALENIQSVGGNIKIKKNYRLTDLCGLRPYLSTGNFNNTYSVYDNGFNPTKQDIIDGNCAQ